MSQPVGVVGLGLLGSAITERLLAGGFQVFIYNRTRAKADALIAKGAVWSDNPLVQCQRVIISLYTSETVATVLEQLDGGLRAGQTLIDTTTGAPRHAEAFAGRFARQDRHFAPRLPRGIVRSKYTFQDRMRPWIKNKRTNWY